MTNGEVFKQVFGFDPVTDPCKYYNWLDQEFNGNIPTIPVCKVEFDKDQLKEIVDKAVKDIINESC